MRLFDDTFSFGIDVYCRYQLTDIGTRHKLHTIIDVAVDKANGS
jgi:hypothetical protein